MFKARRESAIEGDIMLTASQKYGMIPQAEFIEREGRRVVEVIQGKDNLIHVEPDDFVISMRSFQGGLEWCRFTGSTSFHYVPVTPIKHVEPTFFAHLLKSDRYISALRSTTNLIRDGQEIRYSNFVQVPLPIIPDTEQLAIATFLDRETAKIDALIAEQQRLIELLQEKRQAAISHAVTKGLNPDAPMKDSGVEWLGEVPKHWEVTRLGRISIARCDGPFGSGLKSDHYVDNGVRVVRLQNIKSDGFDDTSAAYIDTEYYSSELGEHDVLEGDLLVAGLGDDNNLVGRACAAPASIPPAMVKADCFRFRLDRIAASPDFVAFSLNTSARLHGQILATGTTRSRIPLSVMSSRELALPPKPEQEEIEEFLNIRLGMLSSLRIQVEEAIRLLQERRSALISAAVTGQIDVRGLAPVEPPE
jgi:type I restriction enzyme S subunit